MLTNSGKAKRADCTHPTQQLWKGACNKNLGNSFLLIWRIGEEEKLLSVSRSLWSAGGACVCGVDWMIGRLVYLTPHTLHTTAAATASTAAAGGNLTHLDVRRIPGAY